MRHFSFFGLAVIAVFSLVVGSNAVVYGQQFPVPAYRDVKADGVSMDIYLPDRQAVGEVDRGVDKGLCSTIVAVVNGKDEQGAEYMFKALPYGFAVVVVRCGDSTVAALRDIVSVVKWIRDNGRDYRLDPYKLVLWGNYYQGYLAAMAGCAGTYREGFVTEMEFFDSYQMSEAQATNQEYEAFAALIGADNATNITKVQAVVDFFGPFWNDEVKYNPQVFITPQSPPFFMVYSKVESDVPFDQASSFANALKNQIGYKYVEYLLFPEEMTIGEFFENQQMVDQVFAFLNRILYN